MKDETTTGIESEDSAAQPNSTPPNKGSKDSQLPLPTDPIRKALKTAADFVTKLIDTLPRVGGGHMDGTVVQKVIAGGVVLQLAIKNATDDIKKQGQEDNDVMVAQKYLHGSGAFSMAATSCYLISATRGAGVTSGLAATSVKLNADSPGRSAVLVRKAETANNLAKVFKGGNFISINNSSRLIGYSTQKPCCFFDNDVVFEMANSLSMLEPIMMRCERRIREQGARLTRVSEMIDRMTEDRTALRVFAETESLALAQIASSFSEWQNAGEAPDDEVSDALRRLSNVSRALAEIQDGIDGGYNLQPVVNRHQDRVSEEPFT